MVERRTDTSNFSADFGKTAGDYARYRAAYPDWLFERWMRRGLIKPGMRALDLATGTGLLGRSLAQRGLIVTGLDVAPEMVQAAQSLDKKQGHSITYQVGKAEETGLPSGAFDVVTAGTCWHWFDAAKACVEILRLLKPGGHLLIASQDWLPFNDNLVARTEALVLRHNPTWPLGGMDGLKPGIVRDLRAGGFHAIESTSIDFDIPYSHESWRGRMRASAPISASLPPEGVQAFDTELAALLKRDFPAEPLQVAHCLATVIGRKALDTKT